VISCRLEQLKRILCVGAHSDDIEIGCGGTILKLIDQNPDIEIYWSVFSAPGDRRQEAEKSARDFLGGARASRIQFFEFHESYFPDQWASIKSVFEQLRMECDPDLIFTHFRDDRHQDHHILSDLAWNAFRNHLILEYEVFKYDGDLAQPNVYVPLEEKIGRLKVETILRNFKTQASKHWFTEDAFLGLLRIRGIECVSRYAEAFYCRKLIL
jgi:LmbE family N-acetylglucosaminyl deacetylase